MVLVLNRELYNIVLVLNRELYNIVLVLVLISIE